MITYEVIFLNFTSYLAKDSCSSITIISVLNDAVMIGCYLQSHLYIFSQHDQHFANFTVTGSLIDAMWTPRGHILYTTIDKNKGTGLVSRKVTSAGNMNDTSAIAIQTSSNQSIPSFFSVFNNKYIYLADPLSGIYQSNDDGNSWFSIINATGEWQFLHVIRVGGNGENYWIWELNSATHIQRLRMYSLDANNINAIKDIGVKEVVIQFTYDITLNEVPGRMQSYDGIEHIFVSNYQNKTVHVYSINGLYHCQLLSPDDINDYHPTTVMIDPQRQQLYVVLRDLFVKVFKLAYGEMGQLKCY